MIKQGTQSSHQYGQFKTLKAIQDHRIKLNYPEDTLKADPSSKPASLGRMSLPLGGKIRDRIAISSHEKKPSDPTITLLKKKFARYHRFRKQMRSDKVLRPEALSQKKRMYTTINQQWAEQADLQMNKAGADGGLREAQSQSSRVKMGLN